MPAPTRIFIVPYKNRPEHKFFFCKYMKFILEDISDYEVYFSHQCDARSFNRGAVKNIGFLAMKTKYPNDYKNMTFIFNDIDTMPYHKLFDYTAERGVVKHYYGFNYALGGIVAITGADFERINGFPNFWGWGMEDNVLQKRCENHGITIDRSNFYPIGAREMLQLFDGVSRIISKKDPWRATHDNGIDGLRTIHLLKYSIDEDSSSSQDNVFKEESFKSMFINILSFMTGIRFEQDNYSDYDLRDAPRKIVNPLKATMRIATQDFQSRTIKEVDDWTRIPDRTNFAERHVEEMMKKERDVRAATAKKAHAIIRDTTDMRDANVIRNSRSVKHASRANIFSFIGR